MAPRRAALACLCALLGAALGGCGEPTPGSEPAGAEAGAESRQAAEAERTGFPARLDGLGGMLFALVPAGTFEMGSSPEEVGRGDEETLHEVHILRPYYLSTTEVTNAQFKRFRPEHRSGTTEQGLALEGDDRPVVNVSHEDAVAFAAWTSEEDPRFVYRLPTEAEWEYACRAGGTSPFATGERVTSAQATLVCDEEAALPGRPDAVGSHAANAWGLHDMHGNVAEWCHDRYGPYAAWRQDNPQGAAQGSERVVRGGSWADPPERARSAARAHLPPDHRCATVGFRLAFGLGYGRTDYGRYRVTVRTVDPTAEGGDVERPGWPLYMISVVDRLTDRVNQILDPRWTHLAKPSPITLSLAPGIYYVFSYRMEGERRERSIEMKFNVPGPDIVDCPIPRRYQANPQ